MTNVLFSIVSSLPVVMTKLMLLKVINRAYFISISEFSENRLQLVYLVYLLA